MLVCDRVYGHVPLIVPFVRQAPGRRGTHVWYVRFETSRRWRFVRPITRTVNVPRGNPRRLIFARSRLPRRTATRLPLTSTVAETRRSRPRGSRRRIVKARRLAHGRRLGRIA